MHKIFGAILFSFLVIQPISTNLKGTIHYVFQSSLNVSIQNIGGIPSLTLRWQEQASLHFDFKNSSENFPVFQRNFKNFIWKIRTRPYFDIPSVIRSQYFLVMYLFTKNKLPKYIHFKKRLYNDIIAQF